MRKIISIALTVMVLFLASCKNEEQFAGRKYYSFPRNEGSEMKVAKGAEKENIRIADKNSKQVEQKSVASEIPMKLNNEKSTAIAKQWRQPKAAVKPSAKTQEATEEKAYAKENTHPLQFRKEKPAGEDADVMFILTIVMCVLLPPLGVYLKQKAITKWFWITLFLCLFTFSYWFGFLFGWGLWFVALILALCVAFNILK